MAPAVGLGAERLGGRAGCLPGFTIAAGTVGAAGIRRDGAIGGLRVILAGQCIIWSKLSCFENGNENIDYLMRAFKPRANEGYGPVPLQAAILPLGLIRIFVTAVSYPSLFGLGV